MSSSHMAKSSVFGHTAANLPIIAYNFGTSGPHVLVLGGVHGNEPEGVICAYGLYKNFSRSFPFKLKLTLIPAFNVDGVLSQERRNSAGVDLNRNLPTNDWSGKVTQQKYHPGPSAGSEPETHALVEYIKSHEIAFILSLHSWHPLLNINGACREEAEAIKKITKYEIKEDIGYPTPGCLGTYAGLERDIPTITYEIERGLKTQKILSTHCRAVIEALKITEKKGS